MPAESRAGSPPSHRAQRQGAPLRGSGPRHHSRPAQGPCPGAQKPGPGRRGLCTGGLIPSAVGRWRGETGCRLAGGHTGVVKCLTGRSPSSAPAPHHMSGCYALNPYATLRATPAKHHPLPGPRATPTLCKMGIPMAGSYVARPPRSASNSGGGEGAQKDSL